MPVTTHRVIGRCQLVYGICYGKCFVRKSWNELCRRPALRRIIMIVTMLLAVLMLQSITSARAYEGSQITSPVLSKTVTIDGKWTTPDEWSDAVVATMVYGGTSPSVSNGTAYLYAKHDANNFYFLIDFVSATSLDAVNDAAAIQIDSLHNGGNTPQTDDRRFDSTYPSGGTMWVGTGTGWNRNNPLPSGVQMAMSIGSSTNLAQPHEISEFQIPFSIFPGMQSVIGFAATAYTSSMLSIWPHLYYRDIPNTWGELTISPNPVPEFASIWLVVAASILAVGIIRRKKLSERVNR